MAIAISLPSRGALVTLSLIPVVVPTACLLLFKAIVSRQVVSSFTESRTPPKRGKAAASAAMSIQAKPPVSLPAEVLDPEAPYVVVCERVVSRTVPAKSLTVEEVAAALSEAQKTSALLTAYLRATMEAFSWMPQGLLIRSMIPDPDIRRSFDTDRIRALDFVKGDLADGVYEVTYRGRGSQKYNSASHERVELSTVQIPDREDLTVHVIVVAEVHRAATEVVFVNETWMWRLVPNEKPVMLESAAGRWLHSLIGGWMITKGIWSVTASKKAKAA